jgi:aspartyl-tRNA(Asn)/glutamyl-tRNA(Gln) amidotransferase subunit A
MGELLERPALELAALLRSGRVHVLELVQAALVSLEQQEGHINAFSFIDAERALWPKRSPLMILGSSPGCRSS